MTRQLPPFPSLDHLKHEAKSLRKAHQSKDPECCGVLRKLHRFAKLPNSAIFNSTLKLSEAQFVISLEYGFKNWRDLKNHFQNESSGKDDRYSYNIRVSKPAGKRTNRKALKEQFGERVNIPAIVKQKQSLHDALGPFPILEAEHVICREYRPGDEKEWHRLVQLDGKGFWYGKSVEEIKESFEGMRGRYYEPVYVFFWIIELKETGEIIGDVRVWDWPAPKGRMADYASIAFDAVGPGMTPQAMGEGLTAIGTYLLSNIELVRLQCMVYPEQTLNVACLKQSGFQEEGVLRAWWYDEGGDEWKDEVMFSFLPEDMK